MPPAAPRAAHRRWRRRCAVRRRRVVSQAAEGGARVTAPISNVRTRLRRRGGALRPPQGVRGRWHRPPARPLARRARRRRLSPRGPCKAVTPLHGREERRAAQAGCGQRAALPTAAEAAAPFPSRSVRLRAVNTGFSMSGRCRWPVGEAERALLPAPSARRSQWGARGGGARG